MITHLNSKRLDNYLFNNPQNCLEFLAHIKWKNGFVCKKCAHTKYGRGKKFLNRRCLKCRYDESPTARTLFHKIKFPLNEAFKIVFLICSTPEGISSRELSRGFSICQKTAWFFKRKIQQSCARLENNQIIESLKDASANNNNLKKNMLKEQELGRISQIQFLKFNLDKKPRFSNRVFRIRSVLLNDLKPDNCEHSKLLHSMARGDEWLNHLCECEADQSTSRPLIREMIKAWIKITHVHISHKHLYYYCCEFSFRYRNREQLRKKSTCFKLLKAMIIHPWLSFDRIASA